MTIQANEGPVHAQFASTCYFPLNVSLADTFTPIIDIQNTGGLGNIFLYYIVKDKKIVIWDSQPIGARSTLRADLGAHNIAYYLQYTPTQDEVVNVTFYTGTVGQAYSGSFSRDVGISVTPVPTECDTTHPCPSGYQCVNGKCVAVSTGPSKTILYALGGVAATGLGLIIYGVFRRRK
jgi:LPXTG-motif cell wall-anchored protein